MCAGHKVFSCTAWIGVILLSSMLSSCRSAHLVVNGQGTPYGPSYVMTHTNKNDAIKSEYSQRANCVRHELFVRLSSLYGGGYPLIEKCERYHRRFVRDLLRQGCDATSATYWFYIFGIGDERWTDAIGQYRSSYAAEMLRVYNMRIFAAGNTEPPPIPSALANPARDSGESGGAVLRVHLHLDKPVVRIGEKLVVGIEVENLTDSPVVFPEMFYSPIVLAFRRQGSDLIDDVPAWHTLRHHGFNYLGESNSVFPSKTRTRRDYALTVVDDKQPMTSGVLPAQKGTYEVTVFDLGYYGIPTLCTPVCFQVE